MLWTYQKYKIFPQQSTNQNTKYSTTSLSIEKETNAFGSQIQMVSNSNKLTEIKV